GVAGPSQRKPFPTGGGVPQVDLRLREVSRRQERTVRRKGEALRDRISGRNARFLTVGTAERELMAGDEGKPAVRREAGLSCAGRHVAPPGLLTLAPIPTAYRVARAVGPQCLAVGGQGQGRDRRPVSRARGRDFRARVGQELPKSWPAQATDQFLTVGREGQ